MAELTINQLIKIIIGIFVVVVVVGGLYLFFSNYVVDFFKNLPGEGKKDEVSDVSVPETKEELVEKETEKVKEETSEKSLWQNVKSFFGF
ncbi:hypothetical protein CMI39_02690 [Candidatus Pacearchaeota archaeon]|jgi:hypothetical protein|nr:hypothetical protein [Candidatus Pacearchaeota archaeon]|tara:strand:+ start:1697 stop:1966 length:270 start_codon:yes stop_codon:yes gene_type:complete